MTVAYLPISTRAFCPAMLVHDREDYDCCCREESPCEQGYVLPSRLQYSAVARRLLVRSLACQERILFFYIVRAIRGWTAGDQWLLATSHVVRRVLGVMREMRSREAQRVVVRVCCEVSQASVLLEAQEAVVKMISRVGCFTCHTLQAPLCMTKPALVTKTASVNAQPRT